MTFLEARDELARISGGEYRSLVYTITEGESHGAPAALCRVYIHGQKGHIAPTWRDALDSMRAAMDIRILGGIDEREGPVMELGGEESDDGLKEGAVWNDSGPDVSE